mgnify:CR=1 FL=1
MRGVRRLPAAQDAEIETEVAEGGLPTVLGDGPADVLYKVDQPYNPATEGGILWCDPELAIPWPVGPRNSGQSACADRLPNASNSITSRGTRQVWGTRFNARPKTISELL